VEVPAKVMESPLDALVTIPMDSRHDLLEKW
jgi:hypothetical protein